MLVIATSELGPFLPWVDPGGFDANIGEGIAFFALGLVGALVTIYLFLGEWLPSMGGKAEYETLQIEVEDLEDRRNVLMALREDFTGGAGELSDEQRDEAKNLSEEIGAEIGTKTARADALHRRILAQGLILYAFLGGAFAVLFAETLVQGMLIGFGWTAIADRFGLKREEAAKAGRRDQEIGKLEKAAGEGEDAQIELAAIKRGLRQAGAAADHNDHGQESSQGGKPAADHREHPAEHKKDKN